MNRNQKILTGVGVIGGITIILLTKEAGATEGEWEGGSFQIIDPELVWDLANVEPNSPLLQNTSEFSNIRVQKIDVDEGRPPLSPLNSPFWAAKLNLNYHTIIKEPLYYPPGVDTWRYIDLVLLFYLLPVSTDPAYIVSSGMRALGILGYLNPPTHEQLIDAGTAFPMGATADNRGRFNEWVALNFCIDFEYGGVWCGEIIQEELPFGDYYLYAASRSRLALGIGMNAMREIYRIGEFNITAQPEV